MISAYFKICDFAAISRLFGVGLSDEAIADAIGREAVARTRIVGRDFDLLIRAGLSQRELSVTLYHEILEAATVAVENPDPKVPVSAQKEALAKVFQAALDQAQLAFA